MYLNIPTQLNEVIKKNWVQHLVFWISMITLFALLRTLRNEDIILSWKTLIYEVIPFSGVASAVYINLNLLVPKFLSQQRYSLYGISLVGLAFGNALLVFFIFQSMEPAFMNASHGPHPEKMMFFPAYMFMQFIFISITSFFHFVRENNRLTKIALSVTEIESNRLQAELNSLKAQINPHFLFNTLNNIYSYSLFKSEKTPEMILKLSGLMNYIIYECQEDQVDLSKEIVFIHNYMELEKMRVEDSLKISINVPESPSDYEIAPLLFVPFIENAFKHGANIQSQKPYIRLQLEVNELGMLHFECENLRDTDSRETETSSGGIGLENVNKRLELLYANNYDLDISQQDGMYRVNLAIQLKDN